MQVEPERRAARRRAVAKRGRVLRVLRTRIHRESWPDTCQWENVGEVLSVDQRAAHVVPAVPGQGPEPSLHRVDRFNARVETHVLANLEHELCILIGNLSVVLGDDHFGRDVAISDGTTLGLRDRLVGVRGHFECMLILKCCASA
jgi:hypothetical protein